MGWSYSANAVKKTNCINSNQQKSILVDDDYVYGQDHVYCTVVKDLGTLNARKKWREIDVDGVS